MKIGEYIKYKRQSLGYSQKQLADRMEISKQAVSKWESGHSLPDIMAIPNLACTLNVKPDFLMKIIWTGETGERVVHFVSVNVREQKRTSYAIQIYEVDDFSSAKDIYDKICAGQDKSTMQTLIDYHTHNPARTFTVTLSESVYRDEDEVPYKSLCIESFNLNSLIKTCAQ